MDAFEIKNRVENGSVKVSRLEFTQAFGNIFENLPFSQNFDEDDTQWRILHEDIWSSSTGSWGGENRIVWYGRAKEGGQIEMMFRAIHGDGYARENDEERMDNMVESLQNDWKFIITFDDEDEKLRMMVRIVSALAKATMGDLCIIARQLKILN